MRTDRQTDSQEWSLENLLSSMEPFRLICQCQSQNEPLEQFVCPAAHRRTTGRSVGICHNKLARGNWAANTTASAEVSALESESALLGSVKSKKCFSPIAGSCKATDLFEPKHWEPSQLGNLCLCTNTNFKCTALLRITNCCSNTPHSHVTELVNVKARAAQALTALCKTLATKIFPKDKPSKSQFLLRCRVMCHAIFLFWTRFLMHHSKTFEECVEFAAVLWQTSLIWSCQETLCAPPKVWCGFACDLFRLTQRKSCLGLWSIGFVKTIVHWQLTMQKNEKKKSRGIICHGGAPWNGVCVQRVRSTAKMWCWSESERFEMHLLSPKRGKLNGWSSGIVPQTFEWTSKSFKLCARNPHPKIMFTLFKSVRKFGNSTKNLTWELSLGVPATTDDHEPTREIHAILFSDAFHYLFQIWILFHSNDKRATLSKQKTLRKSWVWCEYLSVAALRLCILLPQSTGSPTSPLQNNRSDGLGRVVVVRHSKDLYPFVRNDCLRIRCVKPSFLLVMLLLYD